MSNRGIKLIREARRRRIFRLSGLYIVGAWVLVQIALAAFPAFDIPETAIRYVWLGTVLGFPIALILGWRYDISGGRIIRTTATDDGADLSIGRTDIAILGALSVVAVILVSGLLGEVSETRAPVEPTPSNESPAEEINPRSIAVLAFENMTDDAANEDFADGIAEEVLNLLARIPGLQVTSRSSAFAFKGRNVEVPEIAAQLGVAHVLEGSVRRYGDQVRITAQLIETGTDAHLWSETFERNFENAFTIQDEIAISIVQGILATLPGVDPGIAATVPDAFVLTLESMYVVSNARSEDDMRQAAALVEQALEIDPDYAAGWQLLGDIFTRNLNSTNHFSFEEANERAKAAYERVIAIDDRNAGIYTRLAMIAWHYEWDFARAENFINRAIALEPGNPWNFEHASGIARSEGRLDDAIEFQQKAMDVDDPSRAAHHYQRLGEILFEARRYDESIESYRKAMSLRQGPVFNMLLARVLLVKGDPEGALDVLDAADVHAAEHAVRWLFYARAMVLHALGDTAGSDAALAQWEFSADGKAPYMIANIHAYRGEIDEAFAALEDAAKTRDNGLRYLLTDPLFENLHDDPRWNALLDEIGLPRRE